MLTVLAKNVDKLKFLVTSNSPAILTGVGVGGTVATAYLTGRASFKAAQVIEREERLLGIMREDSPALSEESEKFLPVTRTEKVKLTWKLYIPAVGTGLVTITSIVAANKISSRRMAALAVASGISERALQEYKDKVVEKLGQRQDTKLRDEIAQDRVNESAGKSQVIITGSGNVLCYDMLTGRYFESSVEAIKKAENKINFEVLQHMYCSLSEFFDELGLPATTYTDNAGWNSDNAPINVILSTTMSPNDRPCIAIDFERLPVMDYTRFD